MTFFLELNKLNSFSVTLVYELYKVRFEESFKELTTAMEALNVKVNVRLLKNPQNATDEIFKNNSLLK